MTCDWHICAQCRMPITVEGASAFVMHDNGVRRVILSVVHDGKIVSTALAPVGAREIARQLLDALNRILGDGE